MGSRYFTTAFCRARVLIVNRANYVLRTALSYAGGRGDRYFIELVLVPEGAAFTRAFPIDLTGAQRTI